MENNYTENTTVENEAQTPNTENAAVENEVETLNTEAVTAENEVENAGEKNTAVDKILQKTSDILDVVLEKAKKIPPKMWIAISGAAVLLIALIVILSSVVGNTYKTPVNMLEKHANNKKVSKLMDYSTKMLNGFCEDEVENLIDIVKKTDNFEDRMEIMEESFEDAIEDYEDEYGSNYKIKYKIVEKEKLDKDELKEIKEGFKDTAKGLRNLVGETEDWDSDDWEDMADEMGLSKSQAKKLVKAVEALYKEMKSAKVTKGYELTVTVITTGSELEEPEEEEITVCVFKVNGRWISENAFSVAGRFLPF